MSDDRERLEKLESRVARLESVTFGFLAVLKDAVGHIWNWLKENVRGSGGRNG